MTNLVGYDTLPTIFPTNLNMKLTTKGRYAVTTLLDFANSQQNHPISIHEVATRHGISASYLERLAGIMRAKGLIKSIRGPNGGYMLAKEAKDITVAEIMLAVNEKIDATRCKGRANCHEGKVCATHHLWEQLNHNIFHFLEGITLSDLMAKPRVAPMPIRFEHA